MKNLKTFLILVFFICSIMPSVAFASWWNPLSWGWNDFFNGHLSPTMIVEQKVTSTIPVVSTTTVVASSSIVVAPPTKKKCSGILCGIVINTPSILNNHQIVSKVEPAVVRIETTNDVGSGMIFRSRTSTSLILTNAHVVKGVNTATVTLTTGDTYTGTVIGRNEVEDVAVLQIDQGGLPAVKLGDSTKLQQGDNVYALGYSFGASIQSSSPDFTVGTVSGLPGDDGTPYIQMSIEIHPGNSGGPLVNQYGEVIGINTYTYTPTTVKTVQLGESVKWAIPINEVETYIPNLDSGGDITVISSATTPHDQSTQPEVNTASLQQQCASSSQSVYDSEMSTASGISTNDPTIQSEINEIQTQEGAAASERDSEIAQIQSEYAPLISSVQNSYNSLAASQSESAARTGLDRYSPDQASGVTSNTSQQRQNATNQIQNEEQAGISQANAIYQSSYAQYEALRQKILAGVTGAKSDAEVTAQAAKTAAYQSCMSQ